MCFGLLYEVRDLVLHDSGHHLVRSKNNMQALRYLPSLLRGRFTSFSLALGASFNSLKRKTRLDKRTSVLSAGLVGRLTYSRMNGRHTRVAVRQVRSQSCDQFNRRNLANVV